MTTMLADWISNMDDFKDFLTHKGALISEFVRQFAVRRRQQRDFDERMRAMVEQRLDDWWFHHQDLPKTPENQARALNDVLEYLAKRAQEARDEMQEETPDF